MHTNTYTHTRSLTQTYLYIYIYIYILTCTTHIHIYTYTHTNIHIHIHTHTHTTFYKPFSCPMPKTSSKGANLHCLTRDPGNIWDMYGVSWCLRNAFFHTWMKTSDAHYLVRQCGCICVTQDNCKHLEQQCGCICVYVYVYVCMCVCVCLCAFVLCTVGVFVRIKANGACTKLVLQWRCICVYV